jgi:hypothetical protein
MYEKFFGLRVGCGSKFASYDQRTIKQKKQFTIMKNAGTCMLVFLGGALAGAATALMLSPKCGADLRESIKEMIDKEMGAIRERYHDLKEHVQ